MENTSVFVNTTSTPSLSIPGVALTVYINTILHIVGILANGVTLLVVFKKGKWDSTDTLVFSLTTSELAVVLLSSGFGICDFYNYIKFVAEKSGTFNRLIIKEIMMCGAPYFYVMSRFVLTVIAAQRFTALKSAVSYARIWKPSTTKVIVFIGALISLADPITRTLLILNGVLGFDESNGMYYFVSTLNTGLRTMMSIVSTIFLVVPTVITWILNCCTIFMMLKRSKEKFDNSSLSEQKYERETRIAKTMLLVSMMNLICSLPSVLVLRFLGLDRFDASHIVNAGPDELKHTIFDVASILPGLNMALNCIFFVWRSQKYKAVFLSFLPCKTPSTTYSTNNMIQTVQTHTDS